ncbi:MAG: hypothetical protein ACKPGK_00480, partial [Verrucomicrobiota bacterium]
MRTFLLPSVVALAALGSVTLANTSWPQWRGPSRDGRLATSPWPASLDEQHLRLRWRVVSNVVLVNPSKGITTAGTS